VPVDPSGADVVIAGAGMAAAATAIRLRALGLRVALVVRDLAPVAGVEAVPLRAIELLDILGAAGVVAAAGAVEVDGPTHEWHLTRGRVPGRFMHVDRAALAKALLSMAEAHGATVQRVRRLPRPEDVPAGVVALVDGTGRAAAWSRPVQTRGHAVAWQFSAPVAEEMAGRVVRGEGWWAYRLGHPCATWVGVVTTADRLRPTVLDAAAARLGVPAASLVPEGRRPAGVQWAAQPVSGRRIAVGDAALAHDPIAGQGIRFALGSAIAAASTVATWAEHPSRREIASAYYRDLVATEEARHRAVLEDLDAEGPAPLTEPDRSPAVVRLAATVVEVPLAIDGHVELGPALRLADGAITRWVGSFDLLHLARLAADPTPRLLLVAELLDMGVDLPSARRLVSWALHNGLLVDAT
jgi:flavin-dependent dehydrogenase